MRLFNHPSDIVLATTNYINEGLKHPRKDDIVGFARGEVLVDVLGTKYKAEVVIGFTKAGICELHDVVNINSTSFEYKTSEALSTILPEGKHLQKRSSLDGNSIAQSDNSVYRKYSISEENSSNIRYSVEDTTEWGEDGKNADESPDVSDASIAENETEKLKAENEELSKQVQRLRYERFRQAAASGEIDARERRRELSRGVDKVLDSIGVSDGRNSRELMSRMSELYESMAAEEAITSKNPCTQNGVRGNR